jgi:4-nitrophenyl phosphatase
MLNFSTIRAVVTDMDGVLWRGDETLPGVTEFFALLRSRGISIALATNNATKTPGDYVDKLAKMGVEGIQVAQIITSSTTAASYLQTQHPAGTPIHVLGSDRLRVLISEAGFTIADSGVAAVVVALDPQLTYDKLKRAALLIRGGAAFIACNEDATYPVPEGLAPGAGSIVAALRTATDVIPLVMGKPHAPMYHAALQYVGQPAANTLMIGDRLNTDIYGATTLGMRTALVLTGVSTPEEAAAAEPAPDAVYSDLVQLMTDWK